MSFRHRLTRLAGPAALVCSAALLAAPGAGAALQVKPPKVTYLPTVEENFTPAHRTPTQIRMIVVHATEGSFLGSVAWLRNPASHASANFVVSRSGRIVELVAKRDIAWQAGNWKVNEKSVGIEHVGITGDPAGFTNDEYRASARLAAYIARTSLIPIDRRHVIGHYQVPDPNDPLMGGGIDNHTDPGPYWNWQHYMKLVRSYAYPRPPRPPVRLGIESSTVYSGQIVAGSLPWHVRTKGPVKRVDFVVDGRVRRSDRRPPFAFRGGLATRKLANGRHLLELRAYSRSGSWTRDRIVLRVRNIPFVLRVGSLQAHASVTGIVPVQALLSGAKPRRVELSLDGRQIDHDTSRPYLFHWDSHRVSNGPHELELRAVAADGRETTLAVPVLVANPGVELPAPADGSTVSGVVQLAPLVTGSGVGSVGFYVDGALRGTATAAPWTFTWDTTRETPGPHVLNVQARGATGPLSDAAVGVVVAPPGG